MSTSRPTSIRIFLTSGEPDGIRIIEKSNWTGVAIAASRLEMTAVLERPELLRPGVYVLRGPGDDGANRLYVGEADVLGVRLRRHVKKKDFWTSFIAFTSTNEGLNKAVVRYLEARLVALAKKANQWEVENDQTPSTPSLSEADRADADWFLDEMLLIYPVLGVDAFEDAAEEGESDAAGPPLVLKERGAHAHGREAADGFIILAGSEGRSAELPSLAPSISEQRRQLASRGVIESKDDVFVFRQDYRFSSPSTAASFLTGGSSNGRVSWKTKEGVTLKARQEALSDG